jgi:hypothetical protein
VPALRHDELAHARINGLVDKQQIGL